MKNDINDIANNDILFPFYIFLIVFKYSLGFLRIAYGEDIH